MVVPLRSQVRLRHSLLHWAYFGLFPPQAAASVRPLFAKREPFGKWNYRMKQHHPKASFFPKGKGRWHGVSRDGGIGKPLSRLAPTAFLNSAWSYHCARTLACGTPCFIGLTSRCSAHSARASCAPLMPRGAFWRGAAATGGIDKAPPIALVATGGASGPRWRR